MRSLPGHSRSRDVISCHVTATSCELQPCWSSNLHRTPVFGFLQPLPGDFRWNDVTSGHIRWRGHVTSFHVMWLPPPVSYSPIGTQSYTKPEFSALYSHFQVTSAEMTLLPVMWGHVTSFAVMWLLPPASYSPVGAQTKTKPNVLAFYSHFLVTSCQMTSLWVTSGHVTSFPVMWLTPCELQPVGAQSSQNPTFRPSTVTSKWLPMRWGHFRVTLGHVRSCDVISCHVTATSCELQPCRSSNLHRTQVFKFLQPLPGDFRWNDCHLLWVTAL